MPIIQRYSFISTSENVNSRTAFVDRYLQIESFNNNVSHSSHFIADIAVKLASQKIVPVFGKGGVETLNFALNINSSYRTLSFDFLF